MDSKEVGFVPEGWIALAEYRDQSRAYLMAVMNFRVP